MFGEPPSVEEPHRPTTWQSGFGDGLSQAFELVGPPVLLGLLGALLDGRLGTGPGFLIGLAVFGVVGSFAKSYYEFAARAARHDEAKPWTRRRA
jgi:F0F1-type ATP synthase assembly protein I